jgi:GTP-binding protein HflX
LNANAAGFGVMGGPGETQIETDRRLIASKIRKLKDELKEVRRTRTLQRSARKRVPYPTVALVGYTNAGKSTLFNRLTQSEVVAEDMLFATLDPTLRGPEAARRPPGHPLRHRGLHLRLAARTGGGVPRHPGRGEGS